jgi:AcrR family transcriptional regulator
LSPSSRRPPAPAVPERPRRGRPPAPIDDRLLDTAAEIFAHRGYRQTDVQEVADALGVGKASLYRRFPSKRALFLAATDKGLRRMHEEVLAAAARHEDPLRQVAAAIRAYLEYFDRNPQHVELLIQERAEFKDRETPTYFAHRRSNAAHWRKLYAGLMSAGRLRRMPVDRLMEVISHLVYGTMFTNFFVGRTRTPARQAADILDVVFHGILEEGRAVQGAGRGRAARPRPTRRRP